MTTREGKRNGERSKNICLLGSNDERSKVEIQRCEPAMPVVKEKEGQEIQPGKH